MDKTDQFIERVQHLPPAPTVVTQLLGLFSDPNRDVDRIVELIGYDPSLTAEVLRRCNSAFFRGAEPASDIFEAVTRLGFYEVYCVVAALMGARTMALARTSGALDAGTLWRHSVTTAVAAATLAGRIQEAEAVAFTAGLLHDVGKLIFASVEESAYGDMVRQSGAYGPALAKAEQAAWGVTHAAVGARLLARWGLPPGVALVVLHHHHSTAATPSFERLAATIYLANLLAHHLENDKAALPDLASSSPQPMGILKLTADDVASVVENTQQGLERVQGLLGMAL